MSEIYLIQESIEEDFRPLFSNYPVSYALTEEDANEILRNSLTILKQVFADLEVLGQCTNRLHVTYTDLETGHHMRVIYTVRKVYNTTLAL